MHIWVLFMKQNVAIGYCYIRQLLLNLTHFYEDTKKNQPVHVLSV